MTHFARLANGEMEEALDCAPVYSPLCCCQVEGSNVSPRGIVSAILPLNSDRETT